MKTVLASALAILSFSTPAFSQTAATAQPNAAGAAQGNLPESMRIQQSGAVAAVATRLQAARIEKGTAIRHLAPAQLPRRSESYNGALLRAVFSGSAPALAGRQSDSAGGTGRSRGRWRVGLQ